MKQMMNIKNLTVVAIVVATLLLLVGCGDEWTQTTITVMPQMQVKKGDSKNRENITDDVEMHIYTVGDTIGWHVASFEDAVAGVMQRVKEGSEEVEIIEPTGREDYRTLDAFIFEGVKNRRAMLVAYDVMRGIYGWRGVEVVPNLDRLTVEFIIHNPSWNKERYYLQNKWATIDSNVPEVPEEPENQEEN